MLVHFKEAMKTSDIIVEQHNFKHEMEKWFSNLINLVYKNNKGSSEQMKIKLVSFVILCTLLLVPIIASAEVTNGNIGYGFTPGRLWASMDAVLGLISAILAGLSLARSAGRFGTGSGRRGAIVAMVVGLVVIAYAGVHVTIFPGGPGTGDGRIGAIFAIVFGLTSMVLAGLTLARSRRTD